MSDSNSKATAFPAETTVYLQRADDLVGGRLSAHDLPAAAASLPPLTGDLLHHLARQAETVSLTQPRYGWAIAAVADAAALHQASPFLQAQAAWYLARAANEWVRPQRVREALERARGGFAAMGQAAWVAACAWQQNAIPWTRPDFKQCAAELTEALAGLKQAGPEQAPFNSFIPACRLSLAFACLLIGDFETAAQQTEAAEDTYRLQQDRLGLGRCWYTRAGYLRRQSRLEEARVWLEQALELFLEIGAPIHSAFSRYNLAHLLRLLKGDFATAEALLHQAADTFVTADLPLWLAQCYGGLALIYNHSGRLAEAGKMLEQARNIYTRYDIPGLRADNLLDSGQFEQFQGNYAAALDYFIQAETLYTEIGNQFQPPVALANQGETYALMGRPQQALHCLETACTRLKLLAIPHRLADCRMRLARLWSHLGRYDQADAYLARAITYYEEARQAGYLTEAYIFQAENLFHQGQATEAMEVLEQAVSTARQQGDRAEEALSHRLLGEILCSLARPGEAASHLQAAEAGFAAAGMVMEQAACQVARGRYYALVGDTAAARHSWQQALTLTQSVMPDLTWQAHAGMAQLAQTEGNLPHALQQYDLAIRALAQLRRRLWQPALAGSYLNRPATMLDRAVGLAAQMNQAREAISFIEESKAQTIAQQFARGSDAPAAVVPSDEVVTLAAEIRWLQTHLRASAATPFSRQRGDAARIQQLRQKVQQYDEALARWERQTRNREVRIATDPFEVARFRRLADTFLGGNWLALDYYLAQDRLICAVITPNDTYTWQAPRGIQIHHALQTCLNARRGGRPPTLRELSILGEWLLPPSIRARLQSEITLLIAPHRQLHQVPWAALEAGGPLAGRCLPAVVPSMHALTLLWQRPESGRRRQDGLVVGISNFEQERPSLPQVQLEVETMRQRLGERGQVLSETAATWPNLLALRGEAGLGRFAFLHIATHAFNDPLTGRVSGIALYDDDVWLDQFWEAAPLPDLITLSACNGSQSVMFEGDEQISLTATCLAAGAHSVVGSLWPVLDEAATRLMLDFYSHFLAGKTPAHALALAQRAALSQAVNVAHWGNFLCIGRP